MHFNRNTATCSYEGGTHTQKSLNSFKFGDFKVRFPSDGAVKGLIRIFQVLARLSRVSSRLVGEIYRPLVCSNWGCGEGRGGVLRAEEGDGGWEASG